MENNRFEDSFRSAFDGAEVLPSDAVWTNIELDLEKASGGQLKRNLLMFQLLAAASVAFALGIAALYYLEQPVTEHDLANETLNNQRISSLPDLTKESAGQKINSEEPTKGVVTARPSTQNVKSWNSDNRENAVANPLLKEQPENAWIEYKLTRRELSDFVKTKKPLLILPKEEERVEPDAGMVLLAQLKDQEKKYRDEEKETASNEKMWASLGVGAGNYKPNRESFWDRNASSSTGESYSVGLNVAGRVSRRFILQGGVSYLTQNADFSSSRSNNGDATLNEFVPPQKFSEFQGTNNGGGIDPYQVNSSLQFVSIPLQAGYLIVDQAFGIQLNGGISTDLFISNTLSPESDAYQKVTQAAGKDSPYRTVNFSGLVGTEISYRIANQYRISVNPGLRYSLNSIYKEGVAAEVIPVTFDVSLRFRYIFK